MRTKLLPLLGLALMLFACNSNQSKKSADCDNCPSAEKVAEKKGSCCDHHKSEKVYTLETLMKDPESLVNKEIKLKGNVLHTCKHSGRRCFLASDDEKVNIRVEAGGKIKGFNQELVGSEILVTGIVKERRLTKEHIEQMEHDLKEKQQKEDGSAETCAAENNNITKMRQWMKAHNKDYYAIYFIQGVDYEAVQ
ncbi:hypothetical protein K4L44_08485 [Halosquirtibacter laminarini]|uniref:Uncharacterized protein n=1 Tax=Halosquirtibacter laminarini TaxID=3374600 RepID=A0AC61NJC0_9BACT|nr:hypothetical protein K4L44_08485 [Prolixibacteraceae bacterium]